MTWMTDHNYLPGSAPPPPGESPGQEQGTAQVVKDQAADLGNSGVQAGKQVADVAREQVSGVAEEAGRQGKNLLQEAQNQLQEQAAHGQQRVAKQLLSISGDLRSMADNSSPGMAADLAQQAASRVRDAGQWLDNREPGQVVTEVQSFARRRPAVFLLLAAGAGLVAGRLTRGLKGAASDDSAATAPARPSDLAAYPSASTANGAETRILPAPTSPRPTPGDELGPAGGPVYGEDSPLVAEDQAVRRDTR
jgi:hypothetical protein